jgi:KTSC domain
MPEQSFAYTDFHFFGWGSRLVSAIYFNSYTNDLLVELAGSKVYSYSNFDFPMFTDFKLAPSAGLFYNSKVKKNSNVVSNGFFGYHNEIDFTDIRTEKAVAVQNQYEVSVQVTLTTTVRVTADNFDSAASLALDKVDNIQGCETDVVAVTGVKRL